MNMYMDKEIEWNTTRVRPKHNVADFRRPNDVMEFASASRAATVPAHAASQCHLGVFHGPPTPSLVASLGPTAAPSSFHLTTTHYGTVRAAEFGQ